MKKSLKECYTNYFGAGNPNAEHWFIGFEPGGNPLNQDQVQYLEKLINSSESEFSRFSENYIKVPFEKGFTEQLFYLLEAFELSSNYSKDENEWTITFPDDGNAFFTNLFLLKFPSEKDENNDELLIHYKKYFDIESNTATRNFLYPASWILERSKLFIEPKYDPKVIFILKKEWNESYFNLLGIDRPIEVAFPYDENNKDNCDIYKFNQRLIVFLKNTYSTKDGIMQLVEKINVV
ncbi:MAG: hypothetical protein IH950_07490 [Bacteroidetes bacterium]|nr:hypothetical protein [Bacteroidota bacterium]